MNRIVGNNFGTMQSLATLHLALIMVMAGVASAGFGLVGGSESTIEPEFNINNGTSDEPLNGIPEPSSSGLPSKFSSPGYSAFPDEDPDSGKFLGIAGSGTIPNIPIICHIGVPAGETSFDLDIFDGDIGANWDQILYGNDYMDFTLYEDPLKDGTGTTVVASWTQNNMVNDAWYHRSFSTSSGAQAPSGNYFYRFEVKWRIPGTSQHNNYFKIRTTGQISIAEGDQFAFMGAPMRIPNGQKPWESKGMDPPVWAGDPNPGPGSNDIDANSYDGNWRFYFYVPTALSSITFIDGDADIVVDDDDANTPNGPPWNEGVHNGTPKDGPSPYYGCNIPPNIKYTITDPDWNSYVNLNPSGNVEWENFIISNDAADNPDHLVGYDLSAGSWDMHFVGMDGHNMNFIEASFEIFTTDDPPLPVSPAPIVEPDNSDTVAPGVTVDYAHSVTNTGATATFDLEASSSQGWNTRIYHDANGNGVLEPSEISAGVISDTGPLTINQTFHIIVQVVVPSTAGSVVDITTITASSRDEWNIQDSAVDTTTVLANNPPVADADGPYSTYEGSAILLDGSGSWDPDGDPLWYFWDLDNDGNYDSILIYPTFLRNDHGTYTVKLAVTDGELWDYDLTTVTVYDLGPSAAFTWSPKPQNEGSSVQFTDQSTSYPDNIVSWYWNFGGFGTSTLQNPQFTFMDNGSYDVTLKVTDEDGSTDTATHTITIQDLAPDAEFAWSPKPQDEGSSMQLTDQSTSYPDNIVSWYWNFGGFGTSTLQNPQFTFMDNGSYDVTLTVTDDDGSTDSISHTITIRDLAPDAQFSWSPEPQDEGSSVQFTDQSTSFPDIIIGWSWDFGDTGTSNVQNPIHVYGDNGNYTVTLTVTDDDGSTDTVTHTITILNVPPDVDAGPDQTVVWGDLVYFNGDFSDPGWLDTHTITWYFGDGETATGTLTPSHLYSIPGVYLVNLTVEDDDGGLGSDTLIVTVLRETPVLHDEDHEPDTWNWTVVYSDEITINLRLTDDDGENLYHQADEPKTVFLEYHDGVSWIYIAEDALDSADDSETLLIYTFEVQQWENMDVCAGDWPIRFRFDGDTYYEPLIQSGTLAVLKETPVMYDWDDDDWNWTVVYSDPITITIKITDDDDENLFHQVDEPKTVYLEYYDGASWVYISEDTLQHPTNNDNILSYTFEVQQWENMDECAGDWPIQFRFDGDIYYESLIQSGILTVLKETPVMYDWDDYDWNWTVVYSDPITITIKITDDDGENLSHQVDQPKIVYLEYHDGAAWLYVTEDILAHPTNNDNILQFTLEVQQWENMDVCAGDWPIRFRFDGDDYYESLIQHAILTVLKETPVMYDADDGDWNWTVIYSDPLTITIQITDDDMENLFHQVDEPKIIYLEFYSNGNSQGYPVGWILLAQDTLDSMDNSENTLTFSFQFTDNITYPVPPFDDGTYDIRFRFDGDSRYESLTSPGLLTIINLAPVADPNGPYESNEGDAVQFDGTGSYDIDTNIEDGIPYLEYIWDFGDGTPLEYGLNPTHIYGDNGVFNVTLTVIDDDGDPGTSWTYITVNNIAPTASNIEAYMYVNFTLRVAGEKWHSVDVYLYEDNSDIWTARVTRYPGSPDEQAATITNVKVDMTKSYTALVDYMPNDPRENGNVWGGNPVWIIMAFEDGSEERLHHTFNVRQSYWDSDHWNHIDPWEVELDPSLGGHNITFEASATDPGSDDLMFTWDFDDGNFSGPNTYYNNGVSPDPYPSPEINPMTATDTAVHQYSASGTYTITLTVMDDDGGTTTITFTLEVVVK